jgi:hypothetical protein
MNSTPEEHWVPADGGIGLPYQQELDGVDPSRIGI